MNVYDFDKTLYLKDSSVEFYKFILRKKPFILKYLPIQLYGFANYYIFHRFGKTEMKKCIYTYFACIEDIDKEIDEFWSINNKDIQSWYKDLHCDDDIVISASPLFLVEPMCKRLGIHTVFASEVDKKTGVTLSKNCQGVQKPEVLKQNGIDLNQIDCFYSDSYADEPLAKCAKKAYMIKGTKITDWVFKTKRDDNK